MMRRPSPTPSLLTAILLAVASGARADEPAPTEEQARFFEAKVRPVLAEQCAKCHGPDKQKSGLRVDSRAALLEGGDSGPAVVPGKPAESRLIAAVRHDDDAPKMPPSRTLPSEQVADLARWVEMGAPWPKGDAHGALGPAPRRGELRVTDKDRAHWAFQPVRRPRTAAVRDRGWAANPIDAFLLASLEAKGLRPNPDAAKHELIRRATYDLTGLPPTPEEVAAFLADGRPDAYERLVDRLLASPHYGEKWGRHWLDLVRFAETNSYERDNPKPNAWRYRDYVIQSLNADKPFDRFTREQLAGDELPDGGAEGLVATGYYRLGIWDDEPTDRDQARYDGLDDVVATTGQVFLGLTIDCARCHDHKIDPIPQKDYYRLLAFFQNINHYRNGGPTDEAPLADRPRDEGARRARLLALERKQDEVRAALAEIEEQFRRRHESSQGGEARRADLDDLRYRFYRDTWDHLPDFAALKPEESGDLPRGLFDLAPRSRDDAFGFVFEGTLLIPSDGGYTFYLDSDDGSRLIVADKAVIEYDGIHGLGQERSATVTLTAGRVPVRLEYFQHSRGLGLNVAWSGPGFSRRALSASERAPAAIDVAALIRTDGVRVLGADRFARYRELRRELEALKRQESAGEMALCVTEAGPAAPETFVLLRGNPHTPGDRVEPGFPQVLGARGPIIPTPAPSARTTGRRTALADWIASPDNPLTARVIANRVWQHHFGRGIVRSPNNFGLQGDAPTHPELLDWLASELVARGWRLKPLHRLIMTSRAYRMSSRGDAEGLAKDPMNDRFWRFDMRRLTAEEVRDSVLAISGSFSPKMYGPGVYPELPAEVLASQSMPGKGWGRSSPEDQGRRSVYVHVKRSLLMPILEGFDLAETDRSSPVRFSTTQPTQALAMLNGDFLNAQAVILADRLRREAGDDVAAQVRLALRLATAREPGPAEVRRGVALVESLRTRAGLAPDSARKALALMALNLNEFLYLD
jgi:mono/diheme cytochrome c family protein